ncbi:hypothetical protein PIB30_013396 [Stylosanthes scabra]|uniref:Uncharacterized protein n=1 Tax=Stylosanthes scabra TaxID=79078 RepID=A0ABU6W9W6_9FABA|nr:hypothetical protein [Stylosanthes scabra]
MSFALFVEGWIEPVFTYNNVIVTTSPCHPVYVTHKQTPGILIFEVIIRASLVIYSKRKPSSLSSWQKRKPAISNGCIPRTPNPSPSPKHLPLRRRHLWSLSARPCPLVVPSACFGLLLTAAASYRSSPRVGGVVPVLSSRRRCCPGPLRPCLPAVVLTR